MFSERRTRLMALLADRSPAAAALFPSAREQSRNSDVDHEFRQESGFHYLTGFDEPDSVALLRPGSDAPFVLFVRPADPEMTIWVGARAGIEGALERHGADEAYPIDELESRLPGLLSGHSDLYYALSSDPELDQLVATQIASRRRGAQRGARPLEALRDPSPLVDGLRLIKSEAEIAALTRAVEITGLGFRRALEATRPGQHEYQVQAAMEAEFRRHGSARNGYPSIVAAADDSCTLHYTSNRKELRDGDLLLIDAGAEYDYYTADVTRTWPVNGRYSPEQRAVYDVVLEAQLAGIACATPGRRFDDVHRATVRTLTEGLRTLAILRGATDDLIEQAAYRPFYMHSTSHWLGLDVHDVGRYRQGDESVVLEAGMCFTIEPGLYLAPDNADIPPALRGIGIRIEDDIVITESGSLNLSAGIPKDADDLTSILAEV